MTISQKLQELQKQYTITAVVDLDAWHTQDPAKHKSWFRNILATVYKESYAPNEIGRAHV